MIYDIAVVGGGIVGLATTRELKERFPGLSVANVEKEDVFNAHQTGRNSGVIHSGIYYKPGSFKAKLCVEGRKLAWEYCDAKGIEYKQVGKLIVATDESELGRLNDLWERGLQNGVEGLEMLDAKGIAEREPHCKGIRAIFSPVTGIVDWGQVSRSYAQDAKNAGTDFFLGHHVTDITRRGGVTVLAARKPFPAFADETIELHDAISISAGQRGLQILLNPQDYLRATQATLADLTQAVPKA